MLCDILSCMAGRKHVVIIVPGVFWRESVLARVRVLFEDDFVPVIHRTPWWAVRVGYEEVLDELVNKVNAFYAEGSMVSLVGASAGGSLCMNAMAASGHVSSIATLSSPLTDHVAPVVKVLKLINPIFRDSIEASTVLAESWSREVQERVLTMVPRFDEFVRLRNMSLPHSTIFRVRAYEHSMSISKAMLKHVDKMKEHFWQYAG